MRLVLTALLCARRKITRERFWSRTRFAKLEEYDLPSPTKLLIMSFPTMASTVASVVRKTWKAGTNHCQRKNAKPMSLLANC